MIKSNCYHAKAKKLTGWLNAQQNVEEQTHIYMTRLQENKIGIKWVSYQIMEGKIDLFCLKAPDRGCPYA